MKKVMGVASFGGHWIQLDLVLSKVYNSNEVIFITTKDLINSDKKCFYVKDCSLKSPLKVLICLFQVFKIISREKPDVIISTGAAPGAMAILVGCVFRKKTLWVDSIANFKKISLSGRIAKFFAQKTLTQWKELEEGNIEFQGALL